jgi:hypothetical protein
MREQLAEVIISDQESTLDNWVDYLSSDDATYPDWLKYYAFRSVISLSTYDKEKHQFGKRVFPKKDPGTQKLTNEPTVAPFPDLNREALAYVLDAIEKKQAKPYRDLQEQITIDRKSAKKLNSQKRQGQPVNEQDLEKLNVRIRETEGR